MYPVPSAVHYFTKCYIRITKCTLSQSAVHMARIIECNAPIRSAVHQFKVQCANSKCSAPIQSAVHQFKVQCTDFDMTRVQCTHSEVQCRSHETISTHKQQKAGFRRRGFPNFCSVPFRIRYTSGINDRRRTQGEDFRWLRYSLRPFLPQKGQIPPEGRIPSLHPPSQVDSGIWLVNPEKS